MPQRRTQTDPLAEYRRKRDFGRTSEPAGEVRVDRARDARLAFVVQQHDATSLHFDLRLELDGVMKSWAVPRGMTFDPAVKRLAMEVEDHPMDYNFFEGTIPASEYGGGTVMIWDRGVYYGDEVEAGEEEEEVLRRQYAVGKVSFTFVGDRLKGSCALVRTEAGAKPKWLLIKHRDAHVLRGVDPAAAFPTSVVTGRTLDEIAEEDATDGFEGAGVSAMLYRYDTEVPTGRGWVWEPAIRGTRAHIYVTPDGLGVVTGLPGAARRFRGVGSALRGFAREYDRSFVLDGEFTSGDDGEPPSFHAFDLLFEDGEVLLGEPWRSRRKRLEAVLGGVDADDVAIVEVVRKGGKSLLDRARDEGWNGIVAKRSDSTYRPGERTADWIKRVFF